MRRVEYNEIRDLLHSNSNTRHQHALGYNSDVPPPLYQARAPGVPDLNRPVEHTTRTVSDKLVEATKRTFPIPQVDRDLEEEVKAPFRTAFSSLRDLPGQSGPQRRAGNLSTLSDGVQHTVGSEDDEDVLPYVAFGPLPDHLRRCTPIDIRRSRTAQGHLPRYRGLGATRTKSQRSTSGARKMPKEEPLYVKMAKRWDQLEQEVFKKERSHRDVKKKQQEERVIKRQARLKMEKNERQARSQLKKGEKEGWRILEELAEEARTVVLQVEEERQRMQEETRRRILEEKRKEAAHLALLERQRMVRDRAERIVDVDRVKLEREEQVARAKLKALEQELLVKARRREAIRQQIEMDAEEEKRQRDAQLAMQQRLVDEDGSDETPSPSPSANAKKPPATTTAKKPANQPVNGTSPTSANSTSNSEPSPSGSPTNREKEEEVEASTENNQRNEATIDKDVVSDQASTAKSPASKQASPTTAAVEPAEDQGESAKHNNDGKEGDDATRNTNPSAEEATESQVTAPTENRVETSKDAEEDKSREESTAAANHKDEQPFSSDTVDSAADTPLSISARDRRRSVTIVDDEVVEPSNASGCETAQSQSLSVSHGKVDRRRSVYSESTVSELAVDHETDTGHGRKHLGEDVVLPIGAVNDNVALGNDNDSLVDDEELYNFGIVFETRKKVVVSSHASRATFISDVALFVYEKYLQQTWLNSIVIPSKHHLPYSLLVSRQQLQMPAEAHHHNYPSAISLLLESSDRPLSALGVIGSTKHTVPLKVSPTVTKLSLVVRHGQQPSDILHAFGEKSLVGESTLTAKLPPEGISLDDAIDYLGTATMETATMEVGNRVVDVHVTIPAIGHVKRSVEVRVVAPLFVNPENEGGNLQLTNANVIEFLPNARVSRNPHMSLQGCSLHFSSNNFPLDEWTFGTSHGIEAMAIHQDSIEAFPQLGKLLYKGKHVATYRKEGLSMSIEFNPTGDQTGGARGRGELVERVMRSVQRKLQCRKENKQEVRIALRTANGSLATELEMHCDAVFTNVPFMVTPSTLRQHRPNEVAPLSILTSEDLDGLSTGIDPKGILVLSLLYCDPERDRLVLSNEGQFYVSGNHLCNRELRIRMATMEQDATNAIRITFNLSCCDSDLRLLLSQVQLHTTKGTKLGLRVLRVTYLHPTLADRVVDIGITVGCPLIVPPPANPMPKFVALGQERRFEWWRTPANFFHDFDTMPCAHIKLSLTSSERDTVYSVVEPFSIDEASGNLLFEGNPVGKVDTLMSSMRQSSESVNNLPAQSSPAASFLAAPPKEGSLTPLSNSLAAPSTIFMIELSLESNNSLLDKLYKSLRFTLKTPALTKIEATIEDPSSSCVDSAFFEGLGYVANPTPTLLVPKEKTIYRQGSREAISGYSLFHKGRIVLPEFKSFASCEIVVELVAGGIGDGEDVVEWLTPEQQAASQKEHSGSEDDDSEPQSLVVEAKSNKTLLVGGVVVGTFESTNLNGNLSINIQAADDKKLKELTLSSILRAIGFRNSDPKLKAGVRTFALRAIFGRDELKVKVHVDVGAALITIPSFGKKVVTQANQILTSIGPKLVVNVKETELVELACIRVEVIDGANWGLNEDRMVLSSDDQLEVVGDMINSNQGVVGKIIFAEGSVSINVSPEAKITGKLLAHLLRSVGFESTTTSASTDPRIVEFFVESNNGDTYQDTVQISIHVPDQPAEVHLGAERTKYVMTGGPMHIAPNATVEQRMVIEGSRSLRVEFLQQHLAADSLLIADNHEEGVEVEDGTTVRWNDEEVGTVATKQNHLMVHFIPDATLECIRHVLRSVAFKHQGRRDRQTHKKVQFGLKQGKLWTRVSIAIDMVEPFIDPATLPLVKVPTPSTISSTTSAVILPDLKLNPAFDPKGAVLTAQVVALIDNDNGCAFEGISVPKNGPPISVDDDTIDVQVGLVPSKTVQFNLDESPMIMMEKTSEKVAEVTAKGRNAQSVEVTASNTAVTGEEFLQVIRCIHVRVNNVGATTVKGVHACVKITLEEAGVGAVVAYVHALVV